MYKNPEKIIPLSIPNITGKEWPLIKECLDTNWVSSVGRFIEEFEKKICAYLKSKFAIACINGTSGLFMALKLAGVKPKDEVIVPSLTFIAPVNAVKYLYAEPVFMDCDGYMNLDPEKLEEFCKRECKITKRGLKNKSSGRIIKAVIPVHVFGNPCDMSRIMKIAGKYGLKVIEDATESIGAYYNGGRNIGKFTATLGDFGILSFNGNKIITTGGGGMIVTKTKKAADKLRYLINQAKDDSLRYIHNDIGYNFRLTNLQAAMGMGQLESLDSFIKIKKGNYDFYKRELMDVPGISLLGIPEGTMPNYWFYSLLVEKEKFGMDSNNLMLKLRKQGIETRPVWYPNHLQKPFRRNQSYRIEKTLWFWQRVLNLPCSVNIKTAELNRITDKIKKFHRVK